MSPCLGCFSPRAGGEIGGRGRAGACGVRATPVGRPDTAQARRERMVEHFGHTAASLERLRGPIGIYIGSKTPPEIAVSVMAEILAVKNGVTLPREIEVASAKASLEGLREPA